MTAGADVSRARFPPAHQVSWLRGKSSAQLFEPASNPYPVFGAKAVQQFDDVTGDMPGPGRRGGKEIADFNPVQGRKCN